MNRFSPRRLPGLLRAFAGSLQLRVFLVFFLPLLIVLVGFLLWQSGMFSASKQKSYDEAEKALYAAWQRADANDVDMSWSASFRETGALQMANKLNSDEYLVFIGSLINLMSSEQYGTSVVVEKSVPLKSLLSYGDDLEDDSQPPYLSLSKNAIRSLTDRKYYYGTGTYNMEDSSSADDSNFDVTMISGDAPVVVWLPEPGKVSYAVLSEEEGTLQPDTWWWLPWLGFGLCYAAILVVVAAFLTWLALRGVTTPLRGMASASRIAIDGGDPQPVRESGPPQMRQLAQAFNKMAWRTSRAQEAEQSFLLSVSHELKTPLTAIKGYGETLAQGRGEPQVAGEVIVKEASRLQRLVQDVLDLGRARKSSFSARSETVDLAVAASEVVERYAEKAREYGLELGLETTGTTLVTADSDRVVQVISNLVENALRCTPADGSVTIRVFDGKIAVSDTGLGLTRDDLARAFDRFYLYERYGKERPVGTGLGLAIVKDLTAAMKGSVEVESSLGVGTTFVVTLPTVAAESRTV